LDLNTQTCATKESCSQRINANPLCAGAPSLLPIVSTPFTSLDDAYTRMACLNSYFVANNDYRCHFLTVYVETTFQMRQYIRTTTLFHNPAWMEIYTMGFADIYRQHIFNWETGNQAAVPYAWAISYQHAAAKDLLIIQNIGLGINAHINRDLANAIVVAGITTNQISKHQDSTNVNNVILAVYNELETPLSNLYGPVLDVSSLHTLVDVTIQNIITAGREGAWINAEQLTFIPGNPIIEWNMEQGAGSIADTLITGPLLLVGPSLYAQLKVIEGPNPVTTYCSLVPWGCN